MLRYVYLFSGKKNIYIVDVDGDTYKQDEKSCFVYFFSRIKKKIETAVNRNQVLATVNIKCQVTLVRRSTY